MNAEKAVWKIVMERRAWKAAMKLEDNIKVSQKECSSKYKTFETSPVGITGDTECGIVFNGMKTAPVSRKSAKFFKSLMNI
jgi:hypothetical protein